eukprot:1108876-Pleurochrysis_carterae.AAC.2
MQFAPKGYQEIRELSQTQQQWMSERSRRAEKSIGQQSVLANGHADSCAGEQRARARHRSEPTQRRKKRHIVRRLVLQQLA